MRGHVNSPEGRLRARLPRTDAFGSERDDERAREDIGSIRAALLEEACAPYRKAGLFAYGFARGKLARDPIFRAIIERGLLLGRKHILDLGCGQGLLRAWLLATARLHGRGQWPTSWPPAPQPQSIRGLELMPRDVARAHRSLGPDCEVMHADIRLAPLGHADAVVMLDVMHYLSEPTQHALLERVRGSLPPGGLLLLRVGNAAGGARFRYSQLVDQLFTFLRGHGIVQLECRTLEQWRSLLAECGFDCKAVPMSEGTLFANELLIAHAR